MSRGLVINPYRFSVAAGGERKVELTLGDWKGDDTDAPVGSYPISLEDVFSGGHDFWDKVQTNGEDVKAFTDENLTTRIALDIANFNKAGNSGKLWVPFGSARAVGSSIWLGYGGAGDETQPDADAEFGSEEVYTGAAIASHDMQTNEAVSSSFTQTGGTDISYGASAYNGFGGRQYDEASSEKSVAAEIDIDFETFSMMCAIYNDAYTTNNAVIWRIGTMNNDMRIKTNGEIEFLKQFSTAEAKWDWAGIAAAGWHTLGVTVDLSSDANDPVVYQDGVAVTLVDDVGGTGTFSPDTTGNLSFGAAVNGVGPWSGRLGEVRWIDGLLSADQQRAFFESIDAPGTFWSAGAGQAA